MSTCCTENSTHPPGQHRCPVNQRVYRSVPTRTVLYHLLRPWDWSAKSSTYYFCDDPECDVVYFGLNDDTLHNAELRTRVGLKHPADDATVCYCFGITRQQALASPEIKAFVIEQTRQHTYSCESLNPSGRCCLKYFPK